MDSELYEIGLARHEITAFEPGMALMGWGMYDNVALDVGLPLWSRAAVVGQGDGPVIVYVCVDLLIVSQGLRLAILERLHVDHPSIPVGPEGLMLTATHTHSGPSGFSHHFWINLAGPGFSDRVFQILVDGVVASIAGAWSRRQPGRIRFGRDTVPLAAGIHFNRSWFAYNKNPEVEPVTFARRDEATDRQMTVLRFEAADGTALGILSWFPIHGTSVHSENTALHPDHKGMACLDFEQGFEHDVVAIFAQEATGDVTSNYRYDRQRKKVVGRVDDDLRAAAYVGGIQAATARRIFDEAGAALAGGVSAALRHVDFTRSEVGSAYARGVDGPRTTEARIGLAFAEGTAEGPGPLRQLRWLTRPLARAMGAADHARSLLQPGYARRYDPKVPFVDLGRGIEGRLLGMIPLSRLNLPVSDPAFRWIQSMCQEGRVPGGSWIPQRVPLQLLRIGPLVIVGSPFEVTTVAGRRLRQTVLDALKGAGVTEVVINPYANAYTGYLTTFEEYQCQHYEAGYTLFGPWSLGALRTAFEGVAAQLVDTDAPGVSGSSPVPEEPGNLAAVAYTKPWPSRHVSPGQSI